MKEGWKYVRLGDVATYINGFAFKPDDWSSKGIPIIRIQNLTDSSRDFNYCNREDIPHKFYVNEGDILISWSATLGVFEWSKGKALLNQHIFKVVFNKIDINKQYFKYAIHLSIDEMAKHTNGATMKHIRKGDFDNIRIPIPPLPEQERIVSLLDAEFAKIDTIKANAEKQLKDAKALFQSALKDYLTPKEGWEEKRFGTIYDVRDGTHDSPKYTETGFPLVTSKNLKKGLIDFSNIKYISEEDYNKINERSRVDIGDVLFAMIGTIGNPVLVADQPEYAIKNMALFKVPCNQSGKYLQYLLSSNLILNKFHSDAKGTTQKFVGLGYLRDFCFPIPNHLEQLEVVKKLEYIEQKINSLQSNFDTTVTLCNDLKQSILKDIFG